MTKPVLTIENLQAGYNDLTILRNIRLTIEDGELVGIFGPNGAGKSTLLRAIAGFATIQQGSVRLGQVRIDTLPPYQRARHGLSYVSGAVFPEMTVLENIVVSARYARREIPSAVEKALDTFPILKEKLSLNAGRLSGGQRKLLAIALGSINEHSCLLLDEPSEGLAPKAVEMIFEHIADMSRNGRAVLLVEQSIKALEIIGRGCVIGGGAITLTGSAVELRASREFRSAYFGSCDEETSPS